MQRTIYNWYTTDSWRALFFLAIISYVGELSFSIQTDIISSAGSVDRDDTNFYLHTTPRRVFKNAQYLVLAPKIVRPGQIYRVSVTLLSYPNPVTVRASLHRDGEQVSSAVENVQSPHTTTLLMKVPFSVIHGAYTLKVEGYENGDSSGFVFKQESNVTFSERHLTILIETNQLVYNLEQTIGIRVILLTTELKPYDDPVDVYLVDSRDLVMKRWVSVYPYLGFVNLEFELPYDYPEGWWKIRVVALKQTEETRILLERWFGHTFDVNVGMPTFILNTEENLEGSILANYSSVATVTGNLTLKALVTPLKKYQHTRFDNKGSSLQQYVDLFHGTYDFSFPMQDLKHLALPLPIENCEIEVQAVVGERFQDFVVKAYARTRVINDKIKLRFLGVSPQVFKPGMPFRTHLAVSYEDLVPLQEEKLASSFVEVDVLATFENRQQRFPQKQLRFKSNGVLELEVDTPDKARSLLIETSFVDESDHIRLARAKLVVLSYYSEKKRYLQISTNSKVVNAGEYAVFHVRGNFYMTSFNFLVMSKGIIMLSASEKVLGMTHSITTFSFPVSLEMAPVSHVVVYSITHDGEIIADSIIVPVHAINKRKFVLDINMKQERSGNNIELVPRLSSETIIGMSGFDSDHISTHGRRQLTPTKVMEAMYTFESFYQKFHRTLWRNRDGEPDQISYFVTSNYGIDNKQTFVLNELVAFTDFNITEIPTSCDPALGLSQCLSGQCYSSFKKCDGFADCNDGTDEGNCFHVDLDGDEDVIDFYLYRRNRQGAFYDATSNNFAWKNKIIGEDQEEYVLTTAPKGPSVYALSAIAMSKDYGLHILTEHVLFDSTKPFFIIVEGPEEATLGEQIGLRVAVLNFQLIEIKAEIILADSASYYFVQVEPLGIVSSYNPRVSKGEMQHLVYVKPVSHLFVHVPVVASKTGEIEVVIIGRTQVAKDVATVVINIIPDGVPVHLHTSLMLDMRNEAYLLRYLDLNITEDPIIPFEETYRRYIFGSPKSKVSVIGDVIGAPFPLDANAPVGLSALRLPEAVKSGEHIMFDFAYVLYTLTYLRLTNQLTPEVQHGMLQYLNKAYVYETVFYRNGAYSMFKGEQPSLWLTSYCTRTFHLARYPDWENHLYIDPMMLAHSIQFILDHQTSEGSFYETTDRPWNRKMNPREPGIYDGIYFRNVSLTAHVLITLNDVTDLVGELRVDVSNARLSAVNYLEKMLPQLTDAYQIAIVTYALLESGSVEAKVGFNMLDKLKREKEGMVYWSPEPIMSSEILYRNQRPFILPRLPGKYDSLAVETTAYALLIYIRYGGILQGQIVRWLNTMRTTNEAFIASQDTIVALQALIEYSFRAHIRDITSMKISVESSSNPGKTKSMYIKNENLAVMHEVPISPYVWGHTEIVAQGAGLSVIQLDSEYNVDKDFLLIQPPIEAFDLTVKGHYHGRNKSHMNIKSCARWTLTSESETSGTAVIELTLPTGYFIHKPDMDRYVHSGAVPRLRRGRVYPKSAVFMFDYLDSVWSCVNFTLLRWYPVANLTRFLKAKVYDYYTPERYKEIIYDDYDLYVLNICEVCGSYQCPYCPFYSIATLPVCSWFFTFMSVISIEIIRQKLKL